MSVRDRVNESMARQQEWGTDNGPYFMGPDGKQQDMREWGDEEWLLNFGEEGLAEGQSIGDSIHKDDEFLSFMAFMESENSRLGNYM